MNPRVKTSGIEVVDTLAIRPLGPSCRSVCPCQTAEFQKNRSIGTPLPAFRLLFVILWIWSDDRRQPTIGSAERTIGKGDELCGAFAAVAVSLSLWNLNPSLLIINKLELSNAKSRDGEPIGSILPQYGKIQRPWCTMCAAR